MELPDRHHRSARLAKRRRSTMAKRNSIQPDDGFNSGNEFKVSVMRLSRSQSYQEPRVTSMQIRRDLRQSTIAEESIRPTVRNIGEYTNRMSELTTRRKLTYDGGLPVRTSQVSNGETNHRTTGIAVNESDGMEKQLPDQASKYTCNRRFCFSLMGLSFALILLAALATTVILTAFQLKPRLSTTTTTISTQTASSSVTMAITTVTTSRTTSTSTSTTRTSTTSSTTSTTTTTTSTSVDLCHFLQWNQTGEAVIGNASKSKTDDLKRPYFIYIDRNDTLYICDYDAHSIRMWSQEGNGSATIANATSGLEHPEGIFLDNDGYLYVTTARSGDRVLRYFQNFSQSHTAAGQSSSGKQLNELDAPLGLAVDNYSNLYIAERANKRIVKWPPNATNGSLVIGANDIPFYGLLLARQSSNQVYVSSKEKDTVFLWSFGSSTPDLNLTQVSNSTNPTLKDPIGIKYDQYGNLYVADQGHNRVIMYCSNSTTGRVVIDGAFKTPELKKAIDIALDSKMNLYVSDSDLKQVIKYGLLP